jgi:uncharacterized protein (TIGR02271 family)
MTTTTHRTTVVGVFNDEASARRAISALAEAGFASSDIQLEEADVEATAEVAAALARSGAPTARVDLYRCAYPAGSILVAVTTAGRQTEAHGILLQSAIAVDELQADVAITQKPSAITGHQADIQTGSGGMLPLREEELVVHKELMQHGEVHIRREVVIVKRTIEVSLRREELVIESYDGPSPSSDYQTGEISPGSVASELRALQPGQVVRLVLLEEEPVIEKRVVVYEEVAIGKNLVPGTLELTADIRHEELRVDNPDRATIVGPGTPNNSRRPHPST